MTSFMSRLPRSSLIEEQDKHIDVIGLIHIADVPGRHQPGTGEINFTNIHRKLAELKYRNVVAMEFHPAGDPVATLRAAKQTVLFEHGWFAQCPSVAHGIVDLLYPLRFRHIKHDRIDRLVQFPTFFTVTVSENCQPRSTSIA